MKLTRSERDTIIKLAQKKVNDKCNKEIEELKDTIKYPDYILKAEKFNEKVLDLEAEIAKIESEYEALRNEYRNSVLISIGKYYIGSNQHNFRDLYVKDKYYKEHSTPNIEDMLNLELLKGVFDVDSFLKKFE